MAPKSKLQLKNQKAAQIRWIDQNDKEMQCNNMNQMKKVNPDIAVMSTLITGTNFKRARLGAAVQGNSFPSESTFYRHQRELIPKIEENVSTRLQKVADSSFEEKNVHLSVDGRYDSVRNAYNCSVTLMDCQKNQVLCIKNVNKEEEGVSSTLLESRGARSFFDDTVKKWGSNAFVSITTDNDNKTFSQAKKSGIKTQRLFDPRHGLKSLNKSIEKVADNLEYNDVFPEILNGNRSKIVSWAVYLINNIDDTELRGLMWTNSPYHMIGHHENCAHGPLPESHKDWELGKKNEEVFKKMVSFFNRTEPFIKNCEFKNTTQCNESLNNLIGMLAPKRLNFTNSYAVRTLIACGMYNDFHFFSSLLCELELDKYIPNESMEDIIRFETEREKEILQKRTSTYREEKNKRRKKQYAKNKSSQEGDYNDDKNKPSFE